MCVQNRKLNRFSGARLNLFAACSQSRKAAPFPTPPLPSLLIKKCILSPHIERQREREKEKLVWTVPNHGQQTSEYNLTDFLRPRRGCLRFSAICPRYSVCHTMLQTHTNTQANILLYFSHKLQRRQAAATTAATPCLDQ